MEEKYCVPIAGKLLQRAYSQADWTLERDGEATCWMLMGYPYTRVYIIGQAMNRQGAECVIKDFNRVWTILGQRGCGWYTEQNTVLLDTTLHTASHPDSVHWMRPWKPTELGAEEPNSIDQELSRKLLAPLHEGASNAQHIGFCTVLHSDGDSHWHWPGLS